MPANDRNIPHSPSLSPQSQSPDEEEYNKDLLYKKLEEMPLDTLKSIITNQLDLEIRLKHKELNLTDEEIGKCESQMITLRKFFNIPPNVNFDNEPNGFTHKYTNLLSKSLNVNYENIAKLQSLSEMGISPSNSVSLSPFSSFAFTNDSHNFNNPGGIEMDNELGGGIGGELPSHSYRTRSTTSSLRPSLVSSRRVTYGCLYRRTDGIIVKLTCPNCLRSNFSSAQGFLNHSRIAHSREYSSQDAAALQCGEILPDDEQDDEGIQSLKNLKLKGLDPQKHLNANEIYFNGLSTSLNYERLSNPPQLNQLNQQQIQLQQLQQPQVKRKGNDQLMKKLIEKGITTNKNEYDKLVHDTMSEVKNSHLFNGEVEESDEVIEEGTIEKEVEIHRKEHYNRNRRKSRGGVGISKPIHTPLPKLKIKLKRNETTEK